MSSDLKDRLEDLVAPPPRARFREELWEKAELRDRMAARRWRLTAIIACGIALAAIGAAGVLAFGSGATREAAGTIDRTASCSVPLQQGTGVFRLSAHADRHYVEQSTQQTVDLPAYADVTVGSGNDAVWLASVANVAAPNHSVSTDVCVKAPVIPLSSAGLPREGVYTPADDGLGNGMGGHCLVGRRIMLRLWVRVGASGRPVAAKLAIRAGTKKLRPVVFIDWSPKRVTVFMSADCAT